MDAVDEAIATLNRINEKDSTVFPKLILYRVPCSDALADDETVQVGMVADVPYVGLLGIINGLFGVDSLHRGFIVANFDGDRITGFTRNVLPVEDQKTED